MLIGITEPKRFKPKAGEVISLCCIVVIKRITTMCSAARTEYVDEMTIITTVLLHIKL